MTERSHLKQFLEKVDMTMEQAEAIFDESQKIESVDEQEYIQTQTQLEELHGELEGLIRAATPEQREELNRTQQQIRQLQNHMILKKEY
ncbi:DUF2524 family protein [Bacillus suaedae]|uniref:DUF2524 family protein n=1 Tax=Halalkalibacter suaedae TaxID=2822140 RepID=A0A940WUE3_9BACI|nr:DUF2524 family protein [Bacillus suaedae]MBP3950647.1 DUF2524 family protein [Bacillus suaedae]